MATLLVFSLCPLPIVAVTTEDFSIMNYNVVGQTQVTSGTTIELHLYLSLMEGPNNAAITGNRNDIRFSIDSDSSFYMDSSAALPKMTWHADNINGEVTIPLTYDGGTRNKVKIQAQVANGNPDLVFLHDTITINVAPPDSGSGSGGGSVDEPQPSTNAPYLRLKPRATPSGNAGERVYVSLEVENLGWENAKNVQIMPIFDENSVFSPDGVNIIQNLGDIAYDKSAKVSFSFLISEKALTKVYQMTFGFRYQDPNGTVYGTATPVTDFIYINVTGGGSGERNLVLSQPEIAPVGTDISVAFKVKNQGDFEAKNLTLTLGGLAADKMALAQGTNVFKPGDLVGGAEVPCTFVLRPATDLANGNYDLTVKLHYEDAEGKTYDEEQQFFVPFTGGTSTSTSVPKIILDRYSCDPTIVQAGENFTLNLSFTNTSSSKPVRNIKIFLTVPSGDSDNASSAAAKGNVFSPVGSSNTFFIESIAPKGVASKSLQFYTIPDASPRTYTLTANFQYEDDKGNPLTSEELIGIPVKQMVKIDTSGITTPPTASVGDYVTLSTDLYNTGRANVSNLMISLEGDFQTENGRYYIGNFQTGAMDTYAGTVIPSQEGSLEGELVIAFNDPAGEQVVNRYPFAFEVTPMAEMPPDMGMPEPVAVPFWKRPLVWGIAGGAVVLFFLLRRNGPLRKFLRRRKEEGEMMDEDI
jgi:hypothetical protein